MALRHARSKLGQRSKLGAQTLAELQRILALRAVLQMCLHLRGLFSRRQTTAIVVDLRWSEVVLGGHAKEFTPQIIPQGIITCRV